MSLFHPTTTLPEAREQVAEAAKHHWDAPVDLRDLTMEKGRLHFKEAQQSGYENGLDLSPWATGQACGRLGIPAPYFRKCPPRLQDEQFNHWTGDAWFQHETGPDEKARRSLRWLLRMSGGNVRGVVTDKYAPLDNLPLLDAILAAVSPTRFTAQAVSIGSESFHLRLLDRTFSRDILPGDTHLAGIHIANSEVGFRSLSLEAVVVRLVCTNGLVRRVAGKSLLRSRHVGLIASRLKDDLPGAVAEAVLQAAGFLEQIALAVKTPLLKPEAATKTLQEAWGLSDSVTEAVAETLPLEAKAETLFGLVNAVTAVAQRYNPDTRYELETRAGELLDTANAAPQTVALRKRLLAPL